MSPAIEFFVPGAPVGKGRPRVTTARGRPRLYTPAKTAGFEALVALAGRDAMAGRPPIAGAVALTLDVCLPVPAGWSDKKRAAALLGQTPATKKPDLDNVLKAIADGLNGVAWIDDVQIVRESTQKRYASTPGVHVRITELTGEIACSRT